MPMLGLIRKVVRGWALGAYFGAAKATHWGMDDPSPGYTENRAFWASGFMSMALTFLVLGCLRFFAYFHTDWVRSASVFVLPASWAIVSLFVRRPYRRQFISAPVEAMEYGKRWRTPFLVSLFLALAVYGGGSTIELGP
jgi:hypothetical protein